jgi:hypothetical protein
MTWMRDRSTGTAVDLSGYAASVNLLGTDEGGAAMGYSDGGESDEAALQSDIIQNQLASQRWDESVFRRHLRRT